MKMNMPNAKRGSCTVFGGGRTSLTSEVDGCSRDLSTFKHFEHLLVTKHYYDSYYNSCYCHYYCCYFYYCYYYCYYSYYYSCYWPLALCPKPSNGTEDAALTDTAAAWRSEVGFRQLGIRIVILLTILLDSNTSNNNTRNS